MSTFGLWLTILGRLYTIRLERAAYRFQFGRLLLYLMPTALPLIPVVGFYSLMLPFLLTCVVPLGVHNAGHTPREMQDRLGYPGSDSIVNRMIVIRTKQENESQRALLLENPGLIGAVCEAHPPSWWDSDTPSSWEGLKHELMLDSCDKQRATSMLEEAVDWDIRSLSMAPEDVTAILEKYNYDMTINLCIRKISGIR